GRSAAIRGAHLLRDRVGLPQAGPAPVVAGYDVSHLDGPVLRARRDRRCVLSTWGRRGGHPAQKRMAYLALAGRHHGADAADDLDHVREAAGRLFTRALPTVDARRRLSGPPLLPGTQHPAPPARLDRHDDRRDADRDARSPRLNSLATGGQRDRGLSRRDVLESL